MAKIVKGGHTFEGLGKPIMTRDHPRSAAAVVVKIDGKERLIRFGLKGAERKPPRQGESAADKAARRAFRARHAKNIAKGPSSAAYWANKFLWS